MATLRPKPPVTRTVDEAAESILQDSFAILRCEDDTGIAEAIRTAWHTARDYFQSDTVLVEEEKNDEKHGLPPPNKALLLPREQHQVIDNGCLLGLNEPSPAKYLFRAFIDHPKQPWPNPRLEQDTRKVAAVLHQLLEECCKAICAKTTTSSSTDTTTTHDDKEPPRKRRKQQHSPPPLLPQVQKQHCPLDYFFYHNRNPQTINCSEHVDRGLLICVCLSKHVSGLEVLPRNDKEYYCVEEEEEANSSNGNDEDNKEARGPSLSSWNNLICIMAGDALKTFCPGIPACVRRVKTPLQQPRISISYELRLL